MKKALILLPLLMLLGWSGRTKGAPGKVARITCPSGVSASAVGTYGGNTFGVACPGQNRANLSPTSTAWSVRMGVETQAGAWDCAFSGDSPTVLVTCGLGGATLTIE